MMHPTRVLALLLLAWIATPFAATAQALNNTWFKVNVTASGYSIAPGTGELKKVSIKTTAYMYLSWNGSGYDFTIFSNAGTKKEPNWQSFISGGFATESANEAIATDVYWEFGTFAGFVGGYSTNLITIKKDSLDNVKSATIGSIGGDMISGTNDGSQVRGSLNVKATLVSPSKVPFRI